MSIASWWRSRRHDDGEGGEPASPGDGRDDRKDLAAASDAGEVVVSWAGPDELARIEGGHCRSVTIPTPGVAAAALDGLVPLAANVGQAAQEHGMAVVKFPEGVGWADLCVRGSDGWNLLSSLGEDGRFNAMAGIRQAGLTPVGAANLVLQAGAVAVGMAYMNQISGQLTALQEGVGEVLREMGLERDAALKTAFDDLRMLGERQREFLATPERRSRALLMADRARHDANEAWNYQLSAIRALGEELAGDRRVTDEGAIRGRIDELASLEARAACAYGLMGMAERVSMGIESDYSGERIEGARRMARRLDGEHEAVMGPVEEELLGRISRIGGRPLIPAEAEDDGYEARNPVDGALHEVGRQVGRLSPARMARAAEEDLAGRRAAARERLLLANEVARAADAYEGQLDDLDFAFNWADALLVGDGRVRAISTRGRGGGGAARSSALGGGVDGRG